MTSRPKQHSTAARSKLLLHTGYCMHLIASSSSGNIGLILVVLLAFSEALSGSRKLKSKRKPGSLPTLPPAGAALTLCGGTSRRGGTWRPWQGQAAQLSLTGFIAII